MGTTDTRQWDKLSIDPSGLALNGSGLKPPCLVTSPSRTEGVCCLCNLDSIADALLPR